MAYQIPQNIRDILAPLAEAVFPIEEWTKGKTPIPGDKFIPPVAAMPWRQPGGGSTLSTFQMEVLKFFELLVDNDAPNEAIAPRWRQVRAEPLRYFQCHSGQSAAEWRAGREGLLPTVRFGVYEADSSNFAFTYIGGDGIARDTISRREFYSSCWGPLLDVYSENPPTNTAAWTAFRGGLQNDAFAKWPKTMPVMSSGFIRQFTIDILNACLGQRNAALASKDPVWQRAVLIEVGENRRPGNIYTVQDAERAVAELVKAINPVS